MIDRIKTWYRPRSNETKAALRTAGQSLVSTTSVFALAAISEASDVLAGQEIGESLGDLSVVAKAWGVGVLSAVTGLVTYARNRWGLSKASYES